MNDLEILPPLVMPSVYTPWPSLPSQALDLMKWTGLSLPEVTSSEASVSLVNDRPCEIPLTICGSVEL